MPVRGIVVPRRRGARPRLFYKQLVVENVCGRGFHGPGRDRPGAHEAGDLAVAAGAEGFGDRPRPARSGPGPRTTRPACHNDDIMKLEGKC